VQKAIQGNPEALGELCKTVTQGILLRVSALLRSHADAEDTAQEILLRMCSKITKLNEPKAFHAWLNRLITHETYRYMHKHYKRQNLLDVADYLDNIVEDNEDFLPQEYLMRQDSRNTIMSIVNKLPVQQRRAVYLYYYDELTMTQVAEIMGLSQQRVSRCLQMARQHISNDLALQKTAQAPQAQRMCYFSEFPSFICAPPPKQSAHE
jgi:RNA polymerase sigma factor (sigma-70 family)